MHTVAGDDVILSSDAQILARVVSITLVGVSVLDESHERPEYASR